MLLYLHIRSFKLVREFCVKFMSNVNTTNRTFSLLIFTLIFLYFCILYYDEQRLNILIDLCLRKLNLVTL
jgi:hypothetical protein